MKKLLRGLKKATSRRGERAKIEEFALAHGLVYFGYVNQHDDEHHIVRGVTVSTKHRDEHYCIGSFDGYDVAFVERTDNVPSPRAAHSITHRWYIFEFDLHTRADLPHIFIGLHSHSESFYKQLFMKYPRLRPLRLGNLGEHTHQFLSHYRVYGAPQKLVEIEQLIRPEVGEMVSKHFGSLAVEIHDGALYIYAERAKATPALLDAMIKNGVWFARHLDGAADSSY